MLHTLKNLLRFLLYHLLKAALGLFVWAGGSPALDELEVAVLRHQLQVLLRQGNRPDLRPYDRALLAAASRWIPRRRWSVFIVTPRTLLRWHQRLVARKWARYRERPRRGRPPLKQSIKDLIVCLAKDNFSWGYVRIKGELKKLGVRVSFATVRNVLKQEGIEPAPRRHELTWRQFLKAHARSLVACDFFTVDTLFLKRLYVLFFIELETRRIAHFAVTSNPTGTWTTFQAQVALDGKVSFTPGYLIRDRDSKFTKSFDQVFEAKGAKVTRTPYMSPKANAYAERAVGTIRRECLDHLLIFSCRHLIAVLTEYFSHYNLERPHRALDLRAPEGDEPPVREDVTDLTVERRDRLGGLIHEYRVAA